MPSTPDVYSAISRAKKKRAKLVSAACGGHATSAELATLRTKTDAELEAMARPERKPVTPWQRRRGIGGTTINSPELQACAQRGRDALTMTPKLSAALIRLRDASVAYRVAVDPFSRVGGYSGRTNEAKRLRGKFEIAKRTRDNAFDDLLAIIDPDSAEDL